MYHTMSYLHSIHLFTNRTQPLLNVFVLHLLVAASYWSTIVFHLTLNNEPLSVHWHTLNLLTDVLDSYLACVCCGCVGQTEAWCCVVVSCPPGGAVPGPCCRVDGARRTTGGAACGPWRQVRPAPTGRAPPQGPPPGLERPGAGARRSGLMERTGREG